MSLILVVEPTEHHGEPVHQALATEGYSVTVVGTADEALRLAAAEAPSVVMISAQLPTAAATMQAFTSQGARPGVVALVDNVDQLKSFEAHADFVLMAPVAQQDYRAAVRQSVASSRAGATPATPTDGNAKLSSEQIFGELLVEVEHSGGGSKKASSAEIFGEVLAELGEDKRAEPAAASSALPTPAVAPAPEAARPVPSSSAAAPGTAAPGTGRPATPKSPPKPRDDDPFDLDAVMREAAAPKPARPAAAPRPTRRSPEGVDDEVQRQLERTLSGFLDAPQRPASKPKPARTKAGSSDIDALLSRTLSSLDLNAKPKAKPRPQRPAEEDAKPAAAAAAGDGAPASAPTSARPAEPPPADPVPTEEAASGSNYRPIAAGQEFGQYTLLEKIAVGGMAEVWKARMKGVEGFQKTVAIKKILNHLTDNESFVTMFIDEAKLAAQLSHPNITHIYDLGKLGDDYYIAMEFIEGRNLRSLLTAAKNGDTRMPTGLALLVGARLASALDYAHRKRGFDDRELGLVHRDVSPQNVLISYEGDIKLCDFGIVKAVSRAQHTQMGALKGKLQYMSPEQAWGRKVDHRSDLFSLGSLLFEMTTGRRLFPGDNEFSVLEAVRECEVPDVRELAPEVPEAVAGLIGRALKKDPDQRFQSAGEMQQQIESLLYAQSPTPSQADLAAFVHRVIQGGRAAAAPAAASTSKPASALTPSPGTPSAAPPVVKTPSDLLLPPVVEAPAAEPPRPAETIGLAAMIEDLSSKRGREGTGVGRAADDVAPLGEPPKIPPVLTGAAALSDTGTGSGLTAPAASAPELASAPATPATDAAPSKPVTGPGTLSADSAHENAEVLLETSRVVEVVLPTKDAQPERIEAGKRGRWWILLLVVAAVAAAVVAWMLLGRRSANPAIVPPPITQPADAEGAAPPGEGSDPASATDPNAEPGAEEGAAEGAAAADSAGEPQQAADAQDASKLPPDLGDVERMVDEELARREAAMRADFEAKERKLEEQLATVRETRKQQDDADAEDEPAEKDDDPPEPRPPAQQPTSLVKHQAEEYPAAGSLPGTRLARGVPYHRPLSKTGPDGPFTAERRPPSRAASDATWRRL